jgi:predicted nucleotidyltransferase component of viral defense system
MQNYSNEIPGGTTMSNVDSIKAKLKNRAIKEHRTFQEVLTVYGLERALYRLSISPYSEHFVLKGGILLYAMYNSDFIRGTADVDLLGQNITNDLELIKKSFIEIFDIQYPDDGIVFDTSTLIATRITEFKKYPGINITIEGFLDRTKIHVHIDIGFGDIVYPSPITMEYPTLLDQVAPILQTYSKESIIAEKFHAIVSLGNANSRMKDFYDIYALLNSYDFESEILAEAIKETFINRKTSFETITAFEDAFVNDLYRLKMWTSFLKAKKVKHVIDFKSVVDQIKDFLSPLVEMIEQSDQYNKSWKPSRCSWE